MSMRMDQRQTLTPRMIQSMEILQMPLAALEERIDQELQGNPVLELREGSDDGQESSQAAQDAPDAKAEFSEGEQALVVRENDEAADFERLDRIADLLENEEFVTNASASLPRTRTGFDGERDGKLDAMANTAARSQNLSDHLLDQWSFIETPDNIRRAGEAIIQHIDQQGYLRTSFDDIRAASKHPLTDAELSEALQLVQTLEPAGVGARTLQECLLLQLSALEADPELARGHDFALERSLITEHLRDLEMNRYPQLSKKLGRSIEDLKSAVKRMSRLHPHPGKQIGTDEAPPITPDAVIYFDDDTGRYEIDLGYDPAPGLYISGMYRRMLKHRTGDKATREFVAANIRNAKWLIDAIQQRKSTIERVIRVVIDAQKDFFDKGPEFLKPLPMTGVADQLGVHVATVSRAVSEKWIQTPRGVFPLRRFFSGGTTDASGQDMSWDAVKEKLKTIISTEDKKKPLSDEDIMKIFAEQGLTLARRTVAKYRKLLNIPVARQRVEY